VIAVPAARRWLVASVEPLSRAGREGYEPTDAERRRLALLGAFALLGLAIVLGGPGPLAAAALAGPAAAGSLVARRARRYRRSVESGLPDISIAVADAVAAGHSVRAAVAASPASLDGPAAVEMGRVAADVEMGTPTADALGAMGRRLRSDQVNALVAALVSQQVAGGDLVALLRRFAAAVAERDRARHDARSATAQARFTGILVVAMPVGAAVFAELLSPGFVERMVSAPGGPVLIALSLAVQVGGFLAIRRLAGRPD
jgi:tight adherence protein B